MSLRQNAHIDSPRGDIESKMAEVPYVSIRDLCCLSVVFDAR